eukprot:1692113-Rhodomonas_salina.1
MVLPHPRGTELAYAATLYAVLSSRMVLQYASYYHSKGPTVHHSTDTAYGATPYAATTPSRGTAVTDTDTDRQTQTQTQTHTRVQGLGSRV